MVHESIAQLYGDAISVHRHTFVSLIIRVLCEIPLVG
jgi:hypothetical protein